MVYYNRVSLKTYAEKKGPNYLAVVRKKDKILANLKLEYSKKEKQPNRLLN